MDNYNETNKRKIQENDEVLSCKLQAGGQTRSIAYRYVCSGDARLHMVGNPDILIRKSKLPNQCLEHLVSEESI